jgi:hypothetical protein
MSKLTASAAGGAMPAEGHNRETYAGRFLKLLALRQAIEKTLHEMAALLGGPEDLENFPEAKGQKIGVAIAVRAPVARDRRAPR